MPKDKLIDYSSTNGSNTDVGGVNIDEGCLPSGINNAIREVMTHLKDFSEGTEAVNAIAVDNLKLDGNTLSSTDTNGNVIIDPNGTGKVGIGTSSPSSLLSVQGDGLAIRMDGTGNTSRGIFMRNTGTGEGQIHTDGNMHFIQEDASRYMRFSTANTERLRILPSGGLTFNGDTATANALDDYEEGTWTPVAEGTTTAGTATYYSNTGQYTKIGDTVYASFHISINTWTSAPAGNLKISGLPYASKSGGNTTGAFMTDELDYSSSSYITACLYLPSSSSFMQIYGTRDNAGWQGTPIENAAWKIYGSITYKTS